MLSHLNKHGNAHMVDISEKNVTKRKALAQAVVSLSTDLLQQLKDQKIPKGDVFATARIAGIQAAKACSNLIPLCHPLPLTGVSIDFSIDEALSQVTIEALCKTTGKTGVEMEAMTAASIAALTFYDMCKSIDKSIIISKTCLVSKSGGKSGDWKRECGHD